MAVDRLITDADRAAWRERQKEAAAALVDMGYQLCGIRTVCPACAREVFDVDLVTGIGRCAGCLLVVAPEILHDPDRARLRARVLRHQEARRPAILRRRP